MLSFLFLFALAACSDDDNDVPDPDTGEDVFVIYLHSQEMEGTSISFAKKGLQPGAGSFPIANIDMDADQVDLPENEFLA